MIAVLGCTGQLGTAFMKALDDDALGVDRSQLDLTLLDAIDDWVAELRPKLIINCAAYTGVDQAETDPVMANRINAEAVGALARAAARNEIRMVTFSTDYVFDGTKPDGYVESDTPSPLNVYGRSKLAGEQLALAAHPGALVVRTSWLMSGTHPCFATTILSRLESGPVGVVTDQRGRPTLVDDLVDGVLRAVAANASGIIHLANQGETTWFDLARLIAELAGYDLALVSPTTSEEQARPAKRPQNSVLDSERLETWGLLPLPHYRPGLERAVGEILLRR